MTHLTFNGPAGILEGLLETRESDWGAVLCHPHPLYGGTMHDGVLNAMHNGFIAGGCSTLRFNFRGVGNSIGDHDQGEGEIDDVRAAVAFLQSQGASHIVLAGYSFGAVMCLKVHQRLSPEAIVLVAPPVQMLENFDVPTVSSLVILGSEDEIVEVSTTANVFVNSSVEILQGSDHFFRGAHDEIERLVVAKGGGLWS